MMLNKWSLNWFFIHSCLLSFFRICGMCPVKLKETPKEKESQIVQLLLYIWSFLHLSFVVSLTYYTFYHFFNTPDDPEFGSFNISLKFSIMVCTHFVILVESLMTRGNHVNIWMRMDIADDLIGKLIPNYLETKKIFFKKAVIKIMFCLLFSVILELIIIGNIQDNASWTFSWYVSIAPLMMSRARHLQHSLYINLLANRFKVIKKELKSIVKLTKLGDNVLIEKNANYHEKLFHKINDIKNIYNTLWESSLLVNRSFGLSQLTNLLQNFIQLTCDLYLIYSILYKNNLDYILGEYFLSLMLLNKNSL